LDVSPGALPLNAILRTEKSEQNVDHRSVAAKIALGSSLIDFEREELCAEHKGEHIIAMDTANNGKIFGCNKCVFERKLTKPVFLAY